MIKCWGSKQKKSLIWFNLCWLWHVFWGKFYLCNQQSSSLVWGDMIRILRDFLCLRNLVLVLRLETESWSFKVLVWIISNYCGMRTELYPSFSYPSQRHPTEWKREKREEREKRMGVQRILYLIMAVNANRWVNIWRNFHCGSQGGMWKNCLKEDYILGDFCQC